MKLFIFAAAFCSRVLMAQDFLWTQTSAPSNQWQFVSSSSDGMKLMALSAGRTNQIWTSTVGGATWVRQIAAPAVMQWSCGVSSSDGTKLFAAVGDGVSGGIYASTDSGLTWAATGAPKQNWWGMASSSDGTKLVAGSSGSGIFHSTNSGATWNKAASPSKGTYHVASSSDGTRLVAVDVFGGIYASTDSGLTWAQTDARSNSWYDVAMSANGSNVVVVAFKSGIFASSDCGFHWTQTSAPRENWFHVVSSSDGTRLVALSSTAGIWISSNSGHTWTQNSETSSQGWRSIASSSDGNRLVAAAGNRIYTDADSGRPPQTHLYRNSSMTKLRDGRWLQAGGDLSEGKSFIYDLATHLWTDAGTMIHARAGHTATLLSDGRVLAFGGVLLVRPVVVPTNAVEIYDPVKNVWQETGSLNVSRQRGYAITLLSNGKLIVTGGTKNLFPAVASAEIYDPVTGKWKLLSPMNDARYGHAAVELSDERVLVAGGEDSQGNWVFTSELYNPASNRWTRTGSVPLGSRYNYTGTLLTRRGVIDRNWRRLCLATYERMGFQQGDLRSSNRGVEGCWSAQTAFCFQHKSRPHVDYHARVRQFLSGVARDRIPCSIRR